MSRRMPDHRLVELLQELLRAYGPAGQEDAVRDICRRELAPCVDHTWIDPAGNPIGVIRGGGGPATAVMAHPDELSMLVKRVEPDGTLHLTPLGTMYPANFGLGPVAVLGNPETLCGVLALGSEHTTKESTRSQQNPTKATGPSTGRMCTCSPATARKSSRQPGFGPGPGVHPSQQAHPHRDRRLPGLLFHGRPGTGVGPAAHGPRITRGRQTPCR